MKTGQTLVALMGATLLALALTSHANHATPTTPRLRKKRHVRPTRRRSQSGFSET